MAGFKTHISASTIAGIGYGTAGYLLLEIDPSVAVVSAGLCGIAGILPDVDSDSGKPVQEVMSFAAAVVPLLLLDHLQQRGLRNDSLVAAGIVAYVFVRFGIGTILRRCTVHRGMWHSLPAVAIAAMITLFFCMYDTPLNRWFKTGAVALGYLVHLTLDEIYSVEWYGGRLRLKKSSGTAMKIWGENLWANLFAFSNLTLMAYLLLYHPLQDKSVTTNGRVLPTLPREASHPGFELDPSWLERR